jgi:hypothetical protein
MKYTGSIYHAEGDNMISYYLSCTANATIRLTPLVLILTLTGTCRMPILLIIGAVRPPHTTVVKITMDRVVDTYMSRCSPGMFSDCHYNTNRGDIYIYMYRERERENEE